MKKIIILCLMLVTLTMPFVLNAEDYETSVDTRYPEFQGDINNPDLLVIHKGNNMWVVKINGVIYVFYPNK